MNEKLTVAICTINPLTAIGMLNSLLSFSQGNQILVILDGRRYFNDGLNRFAHDHNIQLIINEENKGLSYSRNVAMNNASCEYIVFLDDDVVLGSDIIAVYASYFDQGYDMLGGPLRLPRNYPDLPGWLPEGMSSLLGIHTNQRKIWGGNFGFNVRKATMEGISFQIDLGRTGRQLQSGDDTSFVQEYCKKTCSKSLFVDELAVDHFISCNRYSLTYLLRRAFWQGISEVRRHSIFAGIVKEYQRAFSPGQCKVKSKIERFLVGLFLFLCFLSGCVFEIGNPSHFQNRKLER